MFGPLNPPMRDWTGRCVWVIGGTSGIGRAAAHELHRRGAQLAVSGRSEAALQAFRDEHPGALGFALDVGDADSVRSAGDRVMRSLGVPDLVLYSAGHYAPASALHFDLAAMLLHERVNYTGALHVLDAVLPSLIAARRGHISLVGSVAGYRGLPRALAYGPTKAALHHLAEILWLDLRETGIGVSIINPGFVATRLTAQNDFPMPALLSPEEAAHEILAGWKRGRFDIDFPRRFTIWLKLLSVLPPRWHFAAVRRFAS